ncbi:MAG TPA: phosphatase PAP2 family protein [Polyangiaceae bacterium]|nr:phosphatase PAP2 family protein [Polyangiaceae bacterium]
MARPSSKVWPRSRGVRIACYATCLTLWATPARAEGPLDEEHGAGFYWARGGAIAGAMGLTVATTILVEPARPEPTPSEWLGWDNSVRGRLSTMTSGASDGTLLGSVALPIAFEAAQGFDLRSVNAAMLYGEVLWANVLLNTAAKYALPRLRPYNYRDPPAAAYVESQGIDAYLSFYSGHASTAFAAAVGGSYLFSAAHPDSAANPWLWGFESALASATAIWRIRAGKHFYSDVAAGAVVGSALGVGIPLLEGVHHRPSMTDMAFAGGGVIVGVLAAVVAPFPEDGTAVQRATQLRLKVVPAFSDRAAGLTVTGQL